MLGECGVAVQQEGARTLKGCRDADAGVLHRGADAGVLMLGHRDGGDCTALQGSSLVCSGLRLLLQFLSAALYH